MHAHAPLQETQAASYATFQAAPGGHAAVDVAAGKPQTPDPLSALHPESPLTSRWRKLWFLYFDDVLRTGRVFTTRDLWELTEEYTSAFVSREFRRMFNDELERDSNKALVFCAIWHTQRRRMLFSGFLQLLSAICDCATPLVLYSLLKRVIAMQLPMSYIMGHLVVLYLVSLGQIVLGSHSHFQASKTKMQIVAALRTLIFEHAISKQPQRVLAQNKKKRLAEIVQLYTGNVDAVGKMAVEMHSLWRELLQLVVEVILLVGCIGLNLHVTILAIVGFCAIMILATLVDNKLKKKWNHQTERRLNVIYECFRGIQMIKLNAWESKMQDKIERARYDEEKERQRSMMFSIVLNRLNVDAPNIASIFIFSWMSMGSNPLTFSPASVFTALVLFERIKHHLHWISHLCDVIIKGKSALRRIEKYIRGCKHHSNTTPRQQQQLKHQRIHDQGQQSIADDVAVFIERASFTPNTATTKALLLNVNLTVHRGELVVIHGKPGAGKTTLLSALLNDASCLYGDVVVNEQYKIAYSSQEPWLQTLSIRENILFGSAFDEHKYWCIMDACCLLEDLKMLPQGDQTRVGPKGINLSGGQKARIALARACYSDADLYLLDCPFASVDAIVQSDVFTKCIVTLLRSKTILLVTHNPEIIWSGFVDQVVEVGSLSVKVTAADSNSHRGRGETSRSSPQSRCSRREREWSDLPPWRRSGHETGSSRPASSRDLCLWSLSSEVQADIDRLTKPIIPHVSAKSESKSTSFNKCFSVETICAFFFHFDTLRFLLPAIFGLLIYGALETGKDVWLMTWSGTPAIRESEKYTSQAAWLYGILVIGALVASVVSGLLHISAFLNASSRVFHRMTWSLLRAPMTFFYLTPIGEILSRYFVDVKVLDGHIAMPFLLVVRTAISLVACIGFVWYFMGVSGAFILFFIYFVVKKMVSIDFFIQLLQLRLGAEARNLNFIAEALDGSTVIRAFGLHQVDRFLLEQGLTSDRLTRDEYMIEACRNYLYIMCGHVHGAFLILLAFTMTVRGVPPAALGLILRYIFTIHSDILGFCMGVIRSLLDLLNAKRVLEYGRIISESEVHTLAPVDVPPNWPQCGEVVFDHVGFCYAEDPSESSGMALRDVSFTVSSGQKIGVVGRTGSGKSSLAMSIFRVHALVRGRIMIDGVDICRLSLSVLRGSISIIPQTPMFYRCSVRSYLDPFDEFDDQKLWLELHNCGLHGHLESLDAELWDNGENWSLGERQMLCLARALLKPSRVLILDEAFSAVDQESEAKLLSVLDTAFKHSTIFLLTHRLDQVLKFDKIMVMDKGEMVEFGSVEELATNPDSAFYEFLETTLLTF